jgi:hypothetical protein
MEDLTRIYEELRDEGAFDASPDSGKSLDELYAEAAEQEYLDRFTSQVDYLMMQKMEGLI